MLHKHGTLAWRFLTLFAHKWCVFLQHIKATQKQAHNHGALNGYAAPVFFSPMRYYFNKNSTLSFVQRALKDGMGLALRPNDGCYREYTRVIWSER